MVDQLVSYFAGEKQGAVVLTAVGALALGVAAALIATKSGYRGMALPLALVALLELGVGVGVWWRTDAQVRDLLAQIEHAPADMARAELERMAAVMRNFRVIKVVELVVLAAGLALAYAARGAFAFSAGLGCIMQAGAMLVFDFIAERRGALYVEALRRLIE